MSYECVPSGEQDFFGDDRSVEEIKDNIKYHQDQVAYWESRLAEKKLAEQTESQVVEFNRITPYSSVLSDESRNSKPRL